jgi:hypothetical protein
MIWENLAHDKQWYFCGTKILEVARSGVFLARNGSPLPQRKLKHEGTKTQRHEVFL